MLASESVALDMLGFDMVRDVAPGEAVFIDEQGRFYAQACVAMARHTPCIFEYVYFARPDSIIDNISVYKARLRMGEHLAEKIKRERPDHDIDVVIPIPDTSRTSAVQVAQLLGVKYREGFIKNRYIGRTFIMPGQEQRAKSVRSKLNAIDLEFRGKNVLLVDDSIVRGTTSAQIIDMAREAGAKKVYFASAAPPVRYPNVYGIDMPDASELVAAGHTDEEVRDIIGADWLIYQDLGRSHPRGPPRQREDQGFRYFVLLRRIRDRGCDARVPQAPAGRAVRRSQTAASRWRRSWTQVRSNTVGAPARRLRRAPAGGPKIMRLLVIAARADYRLLVRKHVEIEWPDAAIVEHRLGDDSPLDAQFAASAYDAAILVDVPPSAAAENLAATLLAKPEFAPIVLLMLQDAPASQPAAVPGCTGSMAEKSTVIGWSPRSPRRPGISGSRWPDCAPNRTSRTAIASAP